MRLSGNGVCVGDNAIRGKPRTLFATIRVGISNCQFGRYGSFACSSLVGGYESAKTGAATRSESRKAAVTSLTILMRRVRLPVQSYVIHVPYAVRR